MDATKRSTKAKTHDTETSETIPIDFYLLWRSSEQEKLKLQASFGPEVIFNFELVTKLSDGTKQDQNPCVYRLHLDLMRNAEGKLTVKHNNKLYSARQYRLRVSQKGMVMTSNYEENFLREINNLDLSHHFLYDVKFLGLYPGTFKGKHKNITT